MTEDKKPHCAMCGRWFGVGERWFRDKRMGADYCRRCYKKILKVRGVDYG